MQIDIQCRRLNLTRGLRGFGERKIRSVLSRFDERIKKVSLWLSDVNGPKGGQDKNCQVQIVIAGKSPVIVEETRENLYAAINRALQRAGQSVVRKIGRERSRGRRSPPMTPAAG